MTLTQARRFALSLPEAREEPHFDRASFRIRGKIFATALPHDGYLNVFVGEEYREPALALYPDCIEKLIWGGKAVGLRIALAGASPAVVKDLLRKAWTGKAPKSLQS